MPHSFFARIRKLTATAAFVVLAVSQAFAQGGGIRRAAEPIPGRYIVVLAGDDDPLAVGLETQATHRGRLSYVYDTAVRGFAIDLTAQAAQALARDPRVRYIEEDGIVRLALAQATPPWGLDRIDQRTLPLDQTYNYPTPGPTVYVHIIDTGIRTTHTEFGGRASIAGDFITPGGTGADCNGHGTHVGGTIGGATYGVAKNATLIAYRALDCSGSGTTSSVIAAVNAVTEDNRRPAVANMSLGGGVSTTLDSAVQSSIAAGITYVIAAGNSNADASGQSPARVPEAITVAASDQTDTRATFSNWGPVVDIFAPGVNILSAWNTSDTATNTISGTSMASPHVAGVAALYLQSVGNQTPAQVQTALTTNATPNVIVNPSGAPNLLLYMGFLNGPPPPPPPPPTLVANPSQINLGQSSVLTLTTPNSNFHNIFINGVRPSCIYTSIITCTMTVTPSVSTTYQSTATNSAGVPYTMPSAVVTVIQPSTLTASPASIVNGNSSTLTLTTPTANYFNVTINGVPPTTWTCTTTCTGTLVVSPSVTTTYQSAATDNNNVAYTMPSVVVTVTAAAPAMLTANPNPITVGLSTTLTLTTPTANYFNVTINGVPPTTWTCTTTCTGTLVVSPAVTTTYQSAATNSSNVPYTMPSVVVTVNPAPPPGPTLTANPSSITAGQSSTLTLTTPTNNYHNIFINGVRPTCTYSSTSVVCTMTVTPASTTTYQSSATDANNVPYTMPSVTVTVGP